MVAAETLESLIFGNPCEVWIYCPLQLASFFSDFGKKNPEEFGPYFAQIFRTCSGMVEFSQQSQNDLIKFGSERINKYEATSIYNMCRLSIFIIYPLLDNYKHIFPVYLQLC